MNYAEDSSGENFYGTKDPDNLLLPYYNAPALTAVKRFFKNYVNFKGRASKSEYWWSVLFVNIVGLVPGVGVVLPAALAGEVGGLLLSLLIMLIVGLALTLPTLSVSWRRLQDANINGVFALFIFVFSTITTIVIGLLSTNAEGRVFDAPAARR
ncbi:DUF805 domain-containing protein [Canibacter sp. lx-72]|uniref:DUF805 domain-containing protein n=1 Tax=Canibacter zhuwentaonis TaxID=2837491 RepID=UPI001BDCE5CA|nr:DUF805 domain-containing protein [Canibacter zhuwentaonis]MBT1017916.1 DUF805 domain-containing protein [Canibacter zhuwentaonis]MBT1035079.1 DUF805 domain-containing protein [Canibacter zhuwentaonis]